MANITVQSICDLIETVAPLALQESYDNAGLLVGNPHTEVTGVLVCLDVTEAVIQEAIEKHCNLIVSHHPFIFSGLKKITGQNEVQRCVIKAIKHDIAIYSAHTNMDNVLTGVNGKIAEKLGLVNTRILQPKANGLVKLVTFVPDLYAGVVRSAMCEAGAGNIGNYDSCSYNMEGYGTFRANEQATPFVGSKGQVHTETEMRVEVILPEYIKAKVIRALLNAHPYEEPAYDIIPLQNAWNDVGTGIIGDLPEAEEELNFLSRLKAVFDVHTVRHTNLLGKKIQRVAVCGGSGSSFLSAALSAQADVYISGDFKYHEFFHADNKIVIADIGHFESEQFTKEIFYDIIRKKFPNFAIQISEIRTNPINYL